MDSRDLQTIWKTMSRLFRAHPWHGVTIGNDAPDIVNTYIEVTPIDTMKYEIDKVSGHLSVDRPQRFSNICPTLYGLVPQTYCDQNVADFCMEQTAFTGIVGDGDPLDICVLAEKTILQGGVLLKAIPIGGLRLIDDKAADDKIIAVLHDDAVYGKWSDIRDCPAQLINRLRHYFLTYKDAPGNPNKRVEITDVYGRDEAHQVILHSRRDYHQKFGNLEEILSQVGQPDA